MDTDQTIKDTSDKNRPSLDTTALNNFLIYIGSYEPNLIFVPPDQPLYHYTDLGGLQGILNSNDLWLTHSNYLNDTEEIKHGYTIAKEVLATEKDTRTDQRWKEYLGRIEHLLEKPLPEGIYVCCFCQKDNLLSQWRSYSANGTGVSMEFKPIEFSFITGPDAPTGGSMRLWKVFYDVDQQKQIVRSAITYVFNNNLLVQDASQNLLDEKARQAADAIEFFLPTFKNQDFNEEKEWRLIFTPPANYNVKPQFRVTRGMLIPYFSLREIGLAGYGFPDQLPIASVRIGPSTHKMLNLESTRMLLTKAGYLDVDVDISPTPLRS